MANGIKAIAIPAGTSGVIFDGTGSIAMFPSNTSFYF